jgi:hypothetical protein
MPAVTGQVIMRLGHHRRESVSVWELSVLAAALQISPVLLIYPLGLAEAAEYLPGRQAAPFDAARWRSGEICVTAQGDMAPGGAPAPGRAVSWSPPGARRGARELTGAAYRRASRGQAAPAPRSCSRHFAHCAEGRARSNRSRPFAGPGRPGANHQGSLWGDRHPGQTPKEA